MKLVQPTLPSCGVLVALGLTECHQSFVRWTEPDVYFMFLNRTSGNVLVRAGTCDPQRVFFLTPSHRLPGTTVKC